MLVPVHLARAEGVFNELVDPGIDVGLGTGLDFRLGPAQPDGNCIRCHTVFVSLARWTRKSPPNYVARAHYLLGRTVDSGRVWDLAATARYVRARHDAQTPVFLAGEGAGAIWSIYAALLEPDVAGIALSQFPATHMDNSAAPLLNVLRVCDVPEALGLLAPRPVTVVGPAANCEETAAALYRSAGAPEKFTVQK